MEFKYIVILVCSLFTAFLSYKEVVRIDRSRLALRILTSVLMMFAFGALVIPISYTFKKEEPLHELNLLTTGFEQDSVKTISTKYVLDSATLKVNKNLKTKLIGDLAYYLKAHPDIQKINIYGYGLAAQDLSKLASYTLEFHQTPIASGVISCTWPQQLKTSLPLTVQGTYQNTSNNPVKLVLRGFGLNLDSVEAKANTTLNFTLKTQPKQIGKAVYQLITLQGKDTLSVDPIPFIVTTADPLHVMLLTSAPGFESRFLKNWLGENQYSVVFRSQISKDKYSSDFLNQKKVDINHISSSTLKNIDVLIIDEEEWNAITVAEKAAIDQNVNNGMGLIINISEAKAKSTTKRFDSYEVATTSEKPLALKLTSDSNKLSILPYSQNLFLSPNPNKLPLVNDVLGRIVVDRKINGQGQILESTISTSYQWQLAGKKADYAKFWSSLLSTASRKEQIAQDIQIFPKLLTIGERSRLIVSNNTNKIPEISANGIKLHPRQNMELPFEWDVTFWPNQLGWTEFKLNQQTISGFIYGKSDWQTIKNFDKINYTKDFINNHYQNQVKTEKTVITINKEVSKWWFLLLFLFSAGYLWYELRVLVNK